jgi:hypothetical protein
MSSVCWRFGFSKNFREFATHSFISQNRDGPVTPGVTNRGFQVGFSDNKILVVRLQLLTVFGSSDSGFHSGYSGEKLAVRVRVALR